MKIILTQDVKNLGHKDDVVVVKDGYGRNYLIPKGMAKLATDGAMKMLADFCQTEWCIGNRENQSRCIR